MAIANTLVHHEGKLSEDVGWCWAHADARHVIAHDDLIAHDVCPSGAHYPMAWRQLKKRDTCPAEEGKDHTPLCMALIDEALKRGSPGAFTFASACTRAKVLNHLQSTRTAYVGDLKRHRKVVYRGQEQPRQEVARQMPWGAKKPVRLGTRRSWYFSKPMRIPDVAHPVRVVVFWRERGDQEASQALVSTQLGWEVMRMILVYRPRWTGPETCHRDGKPPLGLGACQVRNGEGQTRHGYLVSVADSLLLRSLHQNRAQEWARRTLTTIGEACRAVKAETLERMIAWVVAKLTVDHWSVTDIKTVLAYS
jgi:hypothetical protein